MATRRTWIRRAALYAASGGFLTVAFGVLGGQDAQAAPRPPAAPKPAVTKALKKPPVVQAKRAAKPKAAIKTKKKPPTQARTKAAPRKVVKPKTTTKTVAKRKPATQAKTKAAPKKIVRAKTTTAPKTIAKRKPATQAKTKATPKKIVKPKTTTRTVAKRKPPTQAKTKAVSKPPVQAKRSDKPAKALDRRTPVRSIGKPKTTAQRKGTTKRPAATPVQGKLGKPISARKAAPTKTTTKRLPQSVRLAEDAAERQALTDRQFTAKRRATDDLKNTAPARAAYAESQRGGPPGTTQRKKADKALRDLKNTAPARAAYAESQRGGPPGTAQRERAERTLRMLEQTAPARTAYADSQRGGAPGSGLARQIADARDRAAKLGAVRDAGPTGSVRAYELSEQRAKSASDEVVRLEKQKVDRGQARTQRRNEELARAAQAQVDYNDSQAGRPVGERTGLVVESVAPAVSRVTNPRTGEVRLNDYRIDRDAPPQEKLIPLLSEKAQEDAKRFPIDEYNAAPPGYLITSTAQNLVDVCQEADFECGDDFATGLVATLISNGQQPANTAEAGDQLLAGVLASSVGGRPGLGGGAPRGGAVPPVRPPANRGVPPKTAPPAQQVTPKATTPAQQVAPKATAPAPQAQPPRVPVTAGAPAPRVLVPSKPAKPTDPVRKPEPIRVRPLPDKTPVPQARPVRGTPDRPKPPPRPDPDRPGTGGKTGRSTKSGAPGTPVQPRQPRDPDWNKPAKEPRGVPTSPRAPERPGTKPGKPGAAKPDVNDPATPRSLPDPAAPRTLQDPEQPLRQVQDALRANADDQQRPGKAKGDNGKSDGKQDQDTKDKRRGRAGRTGTTSAKLGLPSDAIVWRWRDIPRIKEADKVRQAIRDRLQQAANEAEKQFRDRPDAEDQRYTGDRAAVVRKARDEAQAATDRKNKEEALVREGRGSEAELKRLRDEANRLWRAHGIAKKREAGSEIDAIWKNMILAQQAEILGEHASDYRLRPSAYFNVNGGGTGKDGQKYTIPDLVLERITPDGKTQYVAHVYDLKTGKKGIEELWRFRTERYARGLFTIEEIRPK